MVERRAWIQLQEIRKTQLEMADIQAWAQLEQVSHAPKVVHIIPSFIIVFDLGYLTTNRSMKEIS